MRQSCESHEKVYYSTPVADFGDMFVLVCSMKWLMSHPFNPGITPTWNTSTWDPVGLKRYELHFWTPAGFFDLGQQVDLYTETILICAI